MTPSLTLDTLCAKPLMWEQRTPGVFHYGTASTNDTTVTYAELDTIDPRIVPVLQELYANNFPPTTGYFLQKTLQLWNSVLPVLSSSDGRAVILGEVLAVLEHKAHNLRFSARCFHVRRIPMLATGKEILFVANTGFRELYKPVPWLEHFWPGLQERLLIAEAIGLSGTDLAQYVFYPTQSFIEPSTLPDGVAIP